MTEGSVIQLPPGVTGFGSPPSDPAPEFAVFHAACRAAARRLGGAVVRAESCAGKVTPNFHRVRLTLGSGSVEVVCNARFPFAAANRPSEVGDMTLDFIDVPGLAELLAGRGFRVLPANELNEPLHRVHLAALSHAERKQAGYWEPRTVGEVVFNFWD